MREAERRHLERFATGYVTVGLIHQVDEDRKKLSLAMLGGCEEYRLLQKMVSGSSEHPRRLVLWRESTDSMPVMS